jgi:hypothetical protein
VADLLTHLPPAHARRVIEHVAAITTTSTEAVINAVIAAFDHERDAIERTPPIRSPSPPTIAAAFRPLSGGPAQGPGPRATARAPVDPLSPQPMNATRRAREAAVIRPRFR